MSAKGKAAWPELVGLSGEEARKIIMKENIRLETMIVPENSLVTYDVKNNRVRLFVDKEGRVIKTPIIK